MNCKMANRGHFVIVHQEHQVVDFIFNHVVLLLPFEILLWEQVKKNYMLYNSRYSH